MEKWLRKAKFRLFTQDDGDLHAAYAEKSSGVLSPCAGFETLYMWGESMPAYCREVGKFLLTVLCDLTGNRMLCCPPLGDYGHYSAARALESLMLLFESAGRPMEMRYVKEWMLPSLRAVQGYKVLEDYDIDESDILYQARDYAFSLRRAQAVSTLEAARQAFAPRALDYEPEARETLLAFFRDTYCQGRACARCAGRCALKALDRALSMSEELGLPVRYALGADGRVLGLAAYSVNGDTLSLLFYETARDTPGADEILRAMIAEDMTDHVRSVVNASDCNRESALEYKRSLTHYIQSKNYRLTFSRR